MKDIVTNQHDFQDTDRDLENIISINNYDAAEEEESDFNFDYDPDSLYHELALR